MSEAETDLGIGVVIDVSDRRCRILYPGGGEHREYALPGAPIQRVRFRVGDTVEDAEGRRFVVEAVEEADGRLAYIGEGQVLPEARLSDRLGVDTVEQRLLAGHVDDPSLYALRSEVLRHRHAWGRSAVRGFAGGRIELVPHQFYVAREVCGRVAPRVMLSDEVGLGKTIEACLILHRLHLRGRAERILILVPDVLVHQWFVELMRRFSLRFSILDEERREAAAAAAPNANSFLDDQLVLCGVDDLAARPERCAEAVAAGWDLVIVDEAHHLEWSAADGGGPAYQLVEALAAQTPGLLLLTATPEQLGPASHFARLRLLDPARYPSLAQFEEEHDAYTEVAARGAALREAGDEEAFRDLLDRHGPGRVIFRNTRAQMPGFPSRIPQLYELEGEGDAPVVNWLVDFLNADTERKVLVICHTRNDAEFVEAAVREALNVKTAMFHEGMTLLQRDRQAAWFAEADGARLLVASAIGGEGRNFQFVQDLVLFDVPDDPEVLEQRIGRLDRIGQKGDIHIHVPCVRGSREAGLARWYHEALQAFSVPMQAGYEIARAFRGRLDEIDDALIAEAHAFQLKARRQIAEGRDRMLEWSSWHPEEAAAIVAEVASADADPALRPFLLHLFDHLGVHVDELDTHDLLLKPGPTFTRDFALPDEGLRVTLSRARALEREDVVLMTWDHPLVSESMQRLAGSPQGTVAFASGTGETNLVLETVHVLECVAPRALDSERFLPPSPIETRVDWQLGPEAARLPERLGAGDVHRVLDSEVLRTEKVPAMFRETAQRAQLAAETLIAEAATVVEATLGGELQRLEVLRAINDHVREDEVEILRTQLAETRQAIADARLRLDSARLVLLEP